jgi:hypothetical protein
MTFNEAETARDTEGKFAPKTGAAAEVALDDDEVAFYRREVAESFERGIITLTDMVETAKERTAHPTRLIGKRDGLVKVWERQGDRIQNAKSLHDVAAIIGFIRLESPSEPDAAEGEKEGEELAISYLRGLARHLPDDGK